MGDHAGILGAVVFSYFFISLFLLLLTYFKFYLIPPFPLFSLFSVVVVVVVVVVVGWAGGKECSGRCEEGE